jgi:hypothetical protein
MTTRQPSSAVIDTTRCPLCGEQNRCAMETERETGQRSRPAGACRPTSATRRSRTCRRRCAERPASARAAPRARRPLRTEIATEFGICDWPVAWAIAPAARDSGGRIRWARAREAGAGAAHSPATTIVGAARPLLGDHAMNELQLAHRGARQHEGVVVGLPHAARQLVEHVGQQHPAVDEIQELAGVGMVGLPQVVGVKRSLASSTLVASTPKLIAVSAVSAMCR